MSETPATSAPSQGPRDIDSTRLLALRQVRDYTRHLVGRILNVVDASIADKTQRDAVKQLVKNEAWDAHYAVVAAWAQREIDLDSDPKIQALNVFPFEIQREITSGSSGGTAATLALPNTVTI